MTGSLCPHLPQPGPTSATSGEPVPLGLEHRAMFLEYQKDDPPQTSEINFTNLFIWRDYYRVRWFLSNGCLALLADPQISEPFGLPPIGAGDQEGALLAMIQRLKDLNPNPTIRRVSETLARRAEALGFTIHEDRDNYDYLYRTEALATLAGRKLHQKKNHYNYFVNNYKFECLPLTPELLPEIKAVQSLWLEAKIEQLGADQLAYEDEAVTAALENFTALNLTGLAIRIAGRMQAFTIGEPLNANTFLVHLEKANPEIRGLFVALASHFCRMLPPEFVYLNREQDLGLPGLRQAKESFRPEALVPKYRLSAENVRF